MTNEVCCFGKMGETWQTRTAISPRRPISGGGITSVEAPAVRENKTMEIWEATMAHHFLGGSQVP